MIKLRNEIKMEVSTEMMSQYFKLRYVHAPESSIKPIKKLEPGQYAIMDKTGRVNIQLPPQRQLPKRTWKDLGTANTAAF